MGEDESQDYNSYPVKVCALEIGWLLKEKEGIEFLVAISRSENLDLYSVPAIKIFIEYLY